MLSFLFMIFSLCLYFHNKAFHFTIFSDQHLPRSYNINIKAVYLAFSYTKQSGCNLSSYEKGKKKQKFGMRNQNCFKFYVLYRKCSGPSQSLANWHYHKLDKNLLCENGYSYLVPAVIFTRIFSCWAGGGGGGALKINHSETLIQNYLSL